MSPTADMADWGHDLLWLPEDLKDNHFTKSDFDGWLLKQRERQADLGKWVNAFWKKLPDRPDGIKLLAFSEGMDASHLAEGVAITNSNRIVLFTVKESGAGDSVMVRPWPRDKRILSMPGHKYQMGTLDVEIIPQIKSVYIEYLKADIWELKMFPNLPLWVGYGDWNKIVLS
jgi:hypothetical protein